MVFEDAPAGVVSARAAGCAVIGVATTYPEERLVGAVFVVADLTSVSLKGRGELAGIWLAGYPP